MKKVSVIVLVGLVVAVACSKDKDGAADGVGGAGGDQGATVGTGGTDGTGGSTYDLPDGLLDYCARAKQYMCDYAMFCRGATDCKEAETYPFVNSTRCEDPLFQSLSEGALTFHKDVADKCLPDTPVCSDYPRWIFDFGCANVFSGNLKPGESCENAGTFITSTPCDQGRCRDTADCESVCEALAGEGDDCSNTDCVWGLSCLDGTCKKPATIGESCAKLSCQNGLHCDDTKTCVDYAGEGESCATVSCSDVLICGTDQKCHRKVAAGDTCSLNVNCPSGYYCYQTSDMDPRTCRAPLPVDSPCPYDGCDNDAGVSCIQKDPDAPDPNVCIQLGAAGESCEPEGCRQGLWCKYTKDKPDGTCVALGGPGDDCTTETGPRTPNGGECFSGTGTYNICIQGTCSGRSPLGGPCESDNYLSCKEGTCGPDKTCVPPRALGESCLPNFLNHACEKGSYCDSETEVCTERKSDNALCEDGLECKSGGCSEDATSTLRCTEGRPSFCL